MGEFMMITILSVFAIYGMFDILYTFLFSETIHRNIKKAVILDDRNDENIEYTVLKYRNDGYEIIILTDEKSAYDNIKFLSDEKIHTIEREIFTQYFEKN